MKYNNNNKLIGLHIYITNNMSTIGAIVPPILTTMYAMRSSALDLSGIIASWVVGVPTGYASHRMMLHVSLLY